MKIFCFALICSLSLNLKAQEAKITMHFSGTQYKEVRVIKPVAGSYYPENYQQYALHADSSIIIPNDLVKTGYLQVNVGYAFKFIIEPHKDYTINFNLKDEQQPFTFSGQNEKGELALNTIVHPDYQNKANFYNKTGGGFAGISKMILDDAKKETDLFAELLQQKQISKSFYNYAAKETMYYYASVQAAVIYSNDTTAEFTDQWDQHFKTYNLNDTSAFVTRSFYDYADQYANWYKTGYMRKKTGTIKMFDIKKSNDYLIDWYHRYADHLNGKTREYMLARFLIHAADRKKYEPELVSLFDDFKNKYPKSIYTKYIKPGMEEIILYNKTTTTTGLTSPAIIIDNYLQINSLGELLEKFKNKTLYVDIWATWCGPCKEEFAFHSALEKFLKDKNAEILYISTDIDERDNDWKKMIGFYGLSGNHIRTSTKLRQDLINKIWNTKGYSIPRYLIIKNGAIVNNNALRPSDAEQLYQQLNKYL